MHLSLLYCWNVTRKACVIIGCFVVTWHLTIKLFPANSLWAGKIWHSALLIGSLSSDDGDGYENVTEKVNSACFQLYRAYSISFNSSNVDNFLDLRLYRSLGKEKESRLVLTSSTKREIRQFHIVVVQRNVQKSVMHVQSCCSANPNLIALLPTSLTSLSSLLKLPTRMLTARWDEL